MPNREKYLNCDVWLPETDIGKFGFAKMNAVEELPEVNFINSEYARKIRFLEERAKTGVMFYEWDWKFERVWTFPVRNAKWLSTFGCVVAPQFSMFYNMPIATQIFSIYKSRWCGAYWQSLGMTVIPDVQWGEKDTFDWCFDGLPKNSVLAIGQRMNRDKEYCTKLFYKGFDEMCKRLNPKLILAYTPKSLELPSGVPIKKISEKGIDKRKSL